MHELCYPLSNLLPIPHRGHTSSRPSSNQYECLTSALVHHSQPVAGLRPSRGTCSGPSINCISPIVSHIAFYFVQLAFPMADVVKRTSHPLANISLDTQVCQHIFDWRQTLSLCVPSHRHVVNGVHGWRRFSGGLCCFRTLCPARRHREQSAQGLAR
jgi:hypothetical protein